MSQQHAAVAKVDLTRHAGAGQQGAWDAAADEPDDEPWHHLRALEQDELQVGEACGRVKVSSLQSVVCAFVLCSHLL